MLKTIFLTILYSLTFLLLAFQIYNTFKDIHAVSSAKKFIATTYEGYTPEEFDGKIYNRENGTYAISIFPKKDVSCSYYVQVKMTWDTKVYEVIDAFEYNHTQHENCLQTP